jgi:hypothetical protein
MPLLDYLKYLQPFILVVLGSREWVSQIEKDGCHIKERHLSEGS